MWYVGGGGGTLGFWSVSSFLICSKLGRVSSFVVRDPVSTVFTGFCVLGVVVLRLGDEYAYSRSLGKGRDLCVPGEWFPKQSPPLPVGGLCRGFWVYVYSVSRVVLVGGGVVSCCFPASQ